MAARPTFASTAKEYMLDAPRRRNDLGQAMPFREFPLEGGAAAALQSASIGDLVALDLFPDTHLQARITGRWGDADGTRVAARIEDRPEGDRLFMSWHPGGARGLVEIASQNLAYEILADHDGRHAVREWLLTDVVCATPAPEGSARGISAPDAAPAANAPASALSAPAPDLSSRPGALGVIYLDFDGETISGTAWAGGATIVAPAAQMSTSQIMEAWERIARDYEIFDVNVTTSRSTYNAAPPNRRTHCIITSNDAAAPGSGGVAFIGTFTSHNNSEKICWSFIDTDPKFCAEIASHEIGHTVGLNHDGRNASGSLPREEYYEGHGDGETGWAPIMGVGYYMNLTQWSKGEYTRANNPEDDLAIMAVRIPLLPDDHGNSQTQAVAVAGTQVAGMIGQSTDFDFFSIVLGTGTHTIQLTPEAHANIDLELQVQNSSGTTLATANPVSQLHASATFTLTSQQTVYLRVTGIGKPTPPASGYTDYDSLGRYILTGFGNQQQAPSTPVGVATKILSATVVRVSWTANPAATSYQIQRNGIPIGTAEGTEFIDSTATASTVYSYAVVAINPYGSSPSSASVPAATPAFHAFIMDGAPDFGGYLLSNPGMTIYAALRGTKLYVATWSPGNNNAGPGNDHFIFVSNTLLSAASTPAPWAKLGFLAIPSNKPQLAGESVNTFAGWTGTNGPTSLFKSPDSFGIMEGVLDLETEFGTVPEEIYLAAAAYQTDNSHPSAPNNGRLTAQAPAGNGDNNIDPQEFLRIPVRSIADAKQNGIYDVLAPERAFKTGLIVPGTANAPVVSWPSVPAKSYDVWAAGDPTSANWTNLTPAGLTAGPMQWEMSFTNIAGAGAQRGFYRVGLR
ncbi:MAG: hypothetical protein IAE97_11205 [Chthoniobacterales bacterium]|nr:hypothetical protein [Chthoniobacterales bacterium]